MSSTRCHCCGFASRINPPITSIAPITGCIPAWLSIADRDELSFADCRQAQRAAPSPTAEEHLGAAIADSTAKLPSHLRRRALTNDPSLATGASLPPPSLPALPAPPATRALAEMPATPSFPAPAIPSPGPPPVPHAPAQVPSCVGPISPPRQPQEFGSRQ